MSSPCPPTSRPPGEPEFQHEPDHRTHRRRRSRPRRGSAHDVPAARGLFRRHRPAPGVGQPEGAARLLESHLRRQRHDRLPHGSLPPDYGRRGLAQAGRRPETRGDNADDDGRAQLSGDAPRRSERRQKLRELTMRTIKTSSGREIPLDGDLLAIVEALFHEVTAKRELERSYDDLKQEIDHLVAQMSADEVREYFSESLFLNHVKYENDRLEAYMRKLEKK